MEPKRESGDDRAMWMFRPMRDNGKAAGGWCAVETLGDVADMLDGANLGSLYELKYEAMTAEEWNGMPEFDGW